MTIFLIDPGRQAIVGDFHSKDRDLGRHPKYIRIYLLMFIINWSKLLWDVHNIVLENSAEEGNTADDTTIEWLKS